MKMKITDHIPDFLAACDRRCFIKTGAAALPIIFYGPRLLHGEEEKGPVKTNFDTVRNIPRTATSMPGLYPGTVVEVMDKKVFTGKTPDEKKVRRMVLQGMLKLTGKKKIEEAWKLFAGPDDVVGIKINPAGGKIISNQPALVREIIRGLEAAGVKKENIIIWDRFQMMMGDAGFSPDTFPGYRLEALQHWEEEGSNRREDGKHISEDKFDPDVFYEADIEGASSEEYFNQHMVAGKKSYFGKLVTRDLTKIINVPVMKNAGNSVTMALKNLAYGVINNTGRLHQIWGQMMAEVCSFPCVRDKCVLHIMDGLAACYDGGPMGVAEFVYRPQTLYFATDPVALDTVGYDRIIAKRQEMKVKTVIHDRYKTFLTDSEKAGLGIYDEKKRKLYKILNT